MSEYQYYEIQAVDRPLNKAEMAELRARHTRKPSFVARIDEAGLGLQAFRSRPWRRSP